MKSLLPIVCLADVVKTRLILKNFLQDKGSNRLTQLRSSLHYSLIEIYLDTRKILLLNWHAYQEFIHGIFMIIGYKPTSLIAWLL